ncbi:MAG: hypothetical protein QMD17_13540 [Rhodocyclaceae bacterium]|nr:hypothetical protein [Rhodocyclaceae bacterium]
MTGKSKGDRSEPHRGKPRHSYDAEKREAWRLLGARLELLTRGDDNIVTLKSRRNAAEPLTA